MRIEYRSSNGEAVETTLDRVVLDELVGGLPVREFRWYRGRKHYSGWYWSSTTSGLVAYESLLELARIMLADFAPDVNAIVGQPFRLIGADGRRIRRHVPDILVVDDDGAARPNRRFFGRKTGSTWLNMINDQSAGLAAKIVSGTPRDSIHTVDVMMSQHGGRVPEVLITDTGSYSDIVFGLLHLLGKQYRPQLAGLPDQRLWRFDVRADYGPLDKAARGVIDPARITEHWDDMCRIAVSINTGEVSAHDVTRMISRDGRPTALGEAIAHYGRIFKTLHILRLADDEPYRREGKRRANLTEGRHDLARNVFHGRKGELHQAYYDGMEDQLSALGLVLNCVVLWNTVYLDQAVNALRDQGYPVLDADAARLSAFIRTHLGLDGHYSFVLPDLGGRPRPLRDPEAASD